MIFPKTCISCKREGAHLCDDCFALISIAHTLSPLPRDSVLSGLFAAASYEDVLVRNIIHFFKYPPFLKDLASPLALSIIAHFSLVDKPSIPAQQIQEPSASVKPQAAFPKESTYVLCPIPLHNKRLRWRGFNHAEEIAKVLSEVLEIPMYSNVLIRTKNTPAQVAFNKQERIDHMKGVFRVQDAQSISHKKVLLVDDVYTTGATMEEAAKALKEAGAKQVWGVVVARG